MPAFTVRAIRPEDRPRLRAILRERWGSDRMAAHGVLYEPAGLDGFVAIDVDTDEFLGILTYHLTPDACEIVTIDALVEGRRIGTTLMDAVLAQGHPRVWLVTTNDNVVAQRFYERLGFRVVAIHHGAVDRARETLKPEIPRTGHDGVPIRDEIELERRADA